MSITKVAKLAGVSTATVSRVVNHYPYVSDRVVKAVQDAMAKLNYQPRKTVGRKPSSRRIAMREAAKLENTLPKPAIFALVTPEVRTSFYPTIIDSFADAADQHAHQILTCCTHNDVGKQGDAILQLIDHRVAGVALIPTTHGMPPVHHLRQLQAHRIPVVLWHRAVTGIAAPLVELDFEGMTRLAGRCIAEAGHRRAAMFLPHKGQGYDRLIVGFQQALRDAGSDCPDELIHYGQRPSVPSVYDAQYRQEMRTALQHMLDLPTTQRPTALYCSWDPLTELIYLTLEKMGCTVPKDMSLISTGGAWRGGMMTNRFTAVTVDEEQAGRWAANLLHEMSTGQRPLHDESRLMIPVQWHTGETLNVTKPAGGARRRTSKETTPLAASA